MKWLVLLVFSIQAEWTSSCVFDKVEEVRGDLYNITRADENACMAKCYEDRNCVGLAYRTISGLCHLFRTSDKLHECIPGNTCYILHRDEVDSVCERYVNV